MSSSQQPQHLNHRLLLVDGLNIVRRVYEAIPGEDSPEKAAGAITASWASFLRALRETSPTHFLGAFDFGGPTWRHELYPEYKIGRSPMPEALQHAIPGFLERLNNAGLKTLLIPGVEADDTMATIALKSKARGFDVILASTDKDMLRLVDNGIQIRDHFKSEYRTEDYVREKFGIPSRLMTDMLALMGDAVDGIPGVKGIGAVTAAKLLNHFGGLDAILNAAESADSVGSAEDILKGAIGDKLRAGAGSARLSRDLAELRLDVPLGISPNDILLPPSVAVMLQDSPVGRPGKGFLRSVSEANSAALLVPASVAAADRAPARMRT